DNSGKTTLINYVRYGDTDTVLVLLHRGADISLLDNSGKTALHYAAIEGDVNILSFFIDRGADVFAQTNEGFVPRDFAER
ncbi:ankyrin repeat-containing domain protein, partial [Baffinella frigidus]